MNAAKARIPTRWFRYKKDKVDICNLCLQKRRLSNDHIPPKGSTQIEEVEVQSLFGFLADDRERPTFIQNGLKYRTLCCDCNSLVGKYDRELNRFSNYIRACVKASIVIPDRMSFTGRPNAIIRALAGHLVAAKLQPDEVAFDQEARKIVFDKDLPIPDKWEVYYWVFPFTSTIVIRECHHHAPRTAREEVHVHTAH